MLCTNTHTGKFYLHQEGSIQTELQLRKDQGQGMCAAGPGSDLLQ